MEVHAVVSDDQKTWMFLTQQSVCLCVYVHVCGLYFFVNSLMLKTNAWWPLKWYNVTIVTRECTEWVARPKKWSGHTWACALHSLVLGMVRPKKGHSHLTILGLTLLCFWNCLLCFWAMTQNFAFYAPVMLSCVPLCHKYALRKLYLYCSITVSSASVNILLG